MGEEGWDVVGSAGHVRVAEHDEGRRGLDRDEPDLGRRQEAQRPLASHQELGEIPPVFGQEVLEGVSRDLTFESAELYAYSRQVLVHEPRELGHGLIPQPAFAGLHPPAVGERHVHARDVVRRAPKRHRVGAARVVPDHPAEGGAVLGGRVRAETQAERGRRLLQFRHDDAGLHASHASFGIDAQDGVHVPRKVQDDPLADGIARARRAAAPPGDRNPEFSGGSECRGDVVGVFGKGDHEGRNPIVRGVRRILGPAACVGVRPARDGPLEPVKEACRVDHRIHELIVPARRAPRGRQRVGFSSGGGAPGVPGIARMPADAPLRRRQPQMTRGHPAQATRTSSETSLVWHAPSPEEHRDPASSSIPSRS